MTQDTIRQLEKELRKQELAALVTLIDEARSATDRSATDVKALMGASPLILHRIEELERKYKELAGRIDGIHQARTAMFGTVAVSAIATAANIVVALVR